MKLERVKFELKSKGLTNKEKDKLKGDIKGKKKVIEIVKKEQKKKKKIFY